MKRIKRITIICAALVAGWSWPPRLWPQPSAIKGRSKETERQRRVHGGKKDRKIVEDKNFVFNLAPSQRADGTHSSNNPSLPIGPMKVTRRRVQWLDPRQHRRERAGTRRVHEP